MRKEVSGSYERQPTSRIIDLPDQAIIVGSDHICCGSAGVWAGRARAQRSGMRPRAETQFCLWPVPAIERLPKAGTPLVQTSSDRKSPTLADISKQFQGQVTSSATCSASRIPISPEISFGNNACLILARLRVSASAPLIRRRSFIACLSNFWSSDDCGRGTTACAIRSGRTAGYALPSDIDSKYSTNSSRLTTSYREAGPTARGVITQKPVETTSSGSFSRISA